MCYVKSSDRNSQNSVMSKIISKQLFTFIIFTIIGNMYKYLCPKRVGWRTSFFYVNDILYTSRQKFRIDIYIYNILLQQVPILYYCSAQHLRVIHLNIQPIQVQNIRVHVRNITYNYTYIQTAIAINLTSRAAHDANKL